MFLVPAVSITFLPLLLAQTALPLSSKPAPRKPAAALQTSFDAVLAGKQAVGRNVDFPAILLPPTAIQATSKNQTRYFVLAVKKEPRLRAGTRVSRFRHYVNLAKMEGKLDALLARSRFGPIGELLTQPALAANGLGRFGR